VTVIHPEPANTRKIEPKVKWATIGSYLAGFLGLFITNLATGSDNELISATIPDWLEAILYPLLPALVALLSSYHAKHQWRVRPGARGGATGSTELG
jgi:hypothetical protein